MAIDGTKIIHAVMEGSRIRESKGIIPLFGVYLSLFSVQYYNRLSFDFEKKIGPTRATEAENLLIKGRPGVRLRHIPGDSQFLGVG